MVNSKLLTSQALCHMVELLTTHLHTAKSSPRHKYLVEYSNIVKKFSLRFTFSKNIGGKLAIETWNLLEMNE